MKSKGFYIALAVVMVSIVGLVVSASGEQRKKFEYKKSGPSKVQKIRPLRIAYNVQGKAYMPPVSYGHATGKCSDVKVTASEITGYTSGEFHTPIYSNAANASVSGDISTGVCSYRMNIPLGKKLTLNAVYVGTWSTAYTLISADGVDILLPQGASVNITKNFYLQHQLLK